MKYYGKIQDNKDLITKEYADGISNASEKTANKVTSISASSTNTQYPSAKCVYDLVGNVEALLAQV